MSRSRSIRPSPSEGVSAVSDASLSDMNLAKLIEHYSDDDKCREVLEDLRWPDGVRCPRCDHDEVYEVRTRNQYQCKSCEYRFSVTAGTIFDNTNLPLWKWFVAIYLMVESKKGISAAQVGRTIDVSYPTAWHLCHRIREAMDDDDRPDAELLSGIVEVDETWVGGKKKNIGRGSMEGMTMVAGAVERDGNVKMDVVDTRSRSDLHGFIERHVSDDAEAIFTDEWAACEGLADDDTRHETVNYSAEEWVRGEIHTNGVESLWGLLQRSIVGAYHKVSVKHLEAYLGELAWRFNNRDNDNIFRDTLPGVLGSEPLKFEALTR